MCMGVVDDGWMDGHGKQILKGNQRKLGSQCHHPPPAQDMVSSHMISH